MKLHKFFILFIANLILSSCLVSNKSSVKIQNTTIDDLYFYTNSIQGSSIKNILIEYNDSDAIGEIYELNRGTGMWVGVGVDEQKILKKITFYHKNKSCPIFSYTREQILDLKVKHGFAEKDYNIIFLVEKDGLKPISKKDYEKAKFNTNSILDKDLLCRKRI